MLFINIDPEIDFFFIAILVTDGTLVEAVAGYRFCGQTVTVRALYLSVIIYPAEGHILVVRIPGCFEPDCSSLFHIPGVVTAVLFLPLWPGPQMIHLNLKTDPGLIGRFTTDVAAICSRFFRSYSQGIRVFSF